LKFIFNASEGDDMDLVFDVFWILIGFEVKSENEIDLRKYESLDAWTPGRSGSCIVTVSRCQSTISGKKDNTIDQ
jgi:hypothetical protein